MCLVLLGLAGLSSGALAQTYQISSVAYELTNGVVSGNVPAGVNGATLQLVGTLPTAAQQSQTSLLACFYTGYGSTVGIPLSPPNSDGTEPLVVPASTIQAIPTANFTAANNYRVAAEVYFIAGGGVCDGTYDATLTNRVAIAVVAPNLTAYSGPTSIPQTNATTGVQAAPTTLTLPAKNYHNDSGTNGSVSTVSFGSFGSSTAKLELVDLNQLNSLSVPVPASFASQPAGTTATLSLCFTATPGSTYTVCTTPSPPITLTVAALAASAGTITATPDPVLTSGQTVLTAQFANAGTGGPMNPGAPSGVVNFSAGGTALPASARLVLDKTATFATQTTTVTTPGVATPVIAPAAGSYTSAQTITITDTTAGAQIYYTQDGSTPTTGSTAYTGPFSISSSQTIQAIAAMSGALNSAVASAAYTITISPPTQLAFAVQPTNSVVNGTITPAVQVAVEDVNGNVVTNATNAVTIALGRNPTEAKLGGTLTVNAVNGIATFPDLTINNASNLYTPVRDQRDVDGGKQQPVQRDASGDCDDGAERAGGHRLDAVRQLHLAGAGSGGRRGGEPGELRYSECNHLSGERDGGSGADDGELHLYGRGRGKRDAFRECDQLHDRYGAGDGNGGAGEPGNDPGGGSRAERQPGAEPRHAGPGGRDHGDVHQQQYGRGNGDRERVRSGGAADGFDQSAGDGCDDRLQHDHGERTGLCSGGAGR